MSHSRFNSLRRLALPACLLFLIVGARWAVLERVGTDLPVWDQWDAEGMHLLSPWVSGHLTLSELFLPHNEHRVVLTKLTNLGLTVLNGEWDQRLEAAANAFLAAAVALTLYFFGRTFIEGRRRALLFIAVATAFAVPFAWANVVMGFHSQQMFLTGTAVAAILCLACEPFGTRRWWTGAFFMIAGLASMASGFFAAAVVAGLLLVRVIHGHQRLRTSLPTLVLAAALVALGWATRVSVYYHEPLKAHSVHDFLMTAARALLWPINDPDWIFLALLLWLPWCIVTLRILFRQARSERSTGYYLTGFGGWVILQILATAYARGNGGGEPPSRYIDTLVFGVLVNALCLGWLATIVAKNSARRIDLAVLSAIWTIVFVIGGIRQWKSISRHDFVTEPIERRYEEQNVRNFLATGDGAYLLHPEIPYPDAGALIQRLNLPGLKDLMPASVRVPIALKAASDRGFVTRDTRTPESAGPAAPEKAGGISPETPPLDHRVSHGSFAQDGALGQGEWVSEPVQSKLGAWLVFQIAGQTGGTTTALELRDVSTNRILETVEMVKGTPGNAWHAVLVRAPKKPFVVVATDASSTGWMAFSDPVEMGTFSYWAWRATRNGLWIAGLAAGAALLIGLGSLRRTDR